MKVRKVSFSYSFVESGYNLRKSAIKLKWEKVGLIAMDPTGAVFRVNEKLKWEPYYGPVIYQTVDVLKKNTCAIHTHVYPTRCVALRTTGSGTSRSGISFTEYSLDEYWALPGKTVPLKWHPVRRIARTTSGRGRPCWIEDLTEKEASHKGFEKYYSKVDNCQVGPLTKFLDPEYSIFWASLMENGKHQVLDLRQVKSRFNKHVYLSLNELRDLSTKLKASFYDILFVLSCYCVHPTKGTKAVLNQINEMKRIS